MQLSASPRPGVVDARLRGHDVVVGKALRASFILLAVAVVAGLLGSPGAVAQDRSDAMLRAFQDACFPRLDDLPARRKKVKEAGFTHVPLDAVTELEWVARLCSDTKIPISCEIEAYRGHREGLELVVALYAILSRGERRRACMVYDFGASGSVGEKKVAEWVGRAADKPMQLRMRGEGWWWGSDVAALPGGYDAISTVFEKTTPGSPRSAAVLRAIERPGREATPK